MRWALTGLISGDNVAQPIVVRPLPLCFGPWHAERSDYHGAVYVQVRGTFFVSKKTNRMTGSYTTKKPSGDGWFEPGEFHGRLEVRLLSGCDGQHSSEEDTQAWLGVSCGHFSSLCGAARPG